MADEIIKELWQIKDEIARECGYDLDALAAYLQAKTRDKNQPVADPQASKISDQPGPLPELPGPKPTIERG